jgi:4-hydroxy-tetrahydrodipicolinate reductase
MAVNPLKIGLLGSSGRMGKMIAQELSSGLFPCALRTAVDKNDNAEAAFKACDVLIDFTAPAATMAHALLAEKHKKPIVVGTTGLAKAEGQALEQAAQTTPVFYSANMSVGVNLLAMFIEQAGAVLKDTDFDIEIFEAHHKHKVDAPSGTALLLGRAAAKGRGVNLSDVMAENRKDRRAPGTIGFSVFRGGDVIGDHTVTFAGSGERIEFVHKASDRALFARGAIRAAMWLKEKPAGFYTMRDLLGL